MSKLLQVAIAARDKFLFYAKEHHAKADKAFDEDKFLTETFKHTRGNDSRRKAQVNEEMAARLTDAIESQAQGSDMLQLEAVQDYRFGSLVKGQHYAYARGLTISPAHLPAALDAMWNDGFELVSLFGEATSEKVGFVFRILGTDPRVQGLLEANSKLVLENRAIREERDELKFRMDGLEK